jgi:hypothetical protein
MKQLMMSDKYEKEQELTYEVRECAWEHPCSNLAIADVRMGTGSL